MPRVASKSAFVAPSFTAIATPWMTSPASGPIMCAPTTRCEARSTTSFMKVRSLLGERELEGAERGLVHVDRAVGLARGLLGQADAGEIRVGEDCGRHVSVVHGRRRVAKQRPGKPHRLRGRDRGQA